MITLFAVSVGAFLLASAADIVMFVQTARHRKEVAANEADIRRLRQEIRNDLGVVKEQSLAAIAYTDKRIREDVADVLQAQAALHEFDQLELQK